MRSRVITLLRKRTFDFSDLTAGTTAVEVPVPEVDVSGFGSAVLVVRVHTNAITGSSAIVVAAYSVAPCDEDPEVVFKATPAVASVTVGNAGASPAGTLLVSGVAEAFGGCLRLEITGSRAGSDTVQADLSVDLVARTSVPAARRAAAVVVRDIDYTAEASATLSDGAVTLGGVEHTVQSSANASQLDLVQGTGLVLRYKTSGAGSCALTSTNNAPAIWTYLKDVVPDHKETHRYLFMWHIDVRASGITFDAAGEVACFFLQKLANLGAIDSFYEEQVGSYDAGGASRAFSGSASNAIAWCAQELATVQRVRTEMDTVDTVMAVRQLDGSRLEVFAGSYDGGWPEVDDLRRVGMTNTDTVGDAGPYDLGLTRLIVGLQGGGGTANPHGVDVHRLRVIDLGV